MKNTILYFVCGLGIIVVVFAGWYFLLYRPYESRIAYRDQAECNDLVEKYQAQTEANMSGMFGSSGNFAFGTPKSHFNNKLHVCLGDFTSIDSTSSGGVITADFIHSINNMVSDEVVVESLAETETSHGVSTTTMTNGLPLAQFQQQEAVLMSE